MRCRHTSKSWRKRIKKRLYRQSQRCHYCGVPLEFHESTIDHLIPRVAGGPDAFKNLKLSCRECNLEKSNKPYAFFVAYWQRNRKNLASQTVHEHRITMEELRVPCRETA